MFQTISILCFYIISMPVYATGFAPQGVLTVFFISVYLLPYFIGVMLVSKRNRDWFSFLSLIIFTLSIGISFLLPGSGEENAIIFLFPYILIIIAFIKRKRKRISI